MTDVVSSARTARERLAQGLGALQGPGVPDHLMNAAEPIARAMSALHRIEASGGQVVREVGPQALDAVRAALGLLQGQTINHPSVEAALEAVAGSLGLVHNLVKVTSAPPPPAPSVQSGPPQALPFKAPPLQAAPVPVEAAPKQPAPVQPPPQVKATPQPHAMPQPAAVQPPAPAGAFAATALVSGPGAFAQSPPMANVDVASTIASAGAAPPASAAVPNSAFAPNSTLQSHGAERPQPGASSSPFLVPDTQPEAKPLPAPAPSPGQLRLEAALGAHSATNFYKGLSGNDVVDAGGIFIATYQIPRIGTPLMLKVSLPGGYEFEAQAIVRWTREPAALSDGASPGFGAQFTGISSEGRQLVYRYVRNREPLFHDDL